MRISQCISAKLDATPLCGRKLGNSRGSSEESHFSPRRSISFLKFFSFLYFTFLLFSFLFFYLPYRQGKTD